MRYRDDFSSVGRDAAWSFPRVLFISIAAVVLIYIVGFFATGGEWAIYKFWAPRMENTRREVFLNTNSYVQGKISHLTQLRLAYEQAEGSQKAALRTTILAEAAQVDNSKLPQDLQIFVGSLRGSL